MEDKKDKLEKDEKTIIETHKMEAPEPWPEPPEEGEGSQEEAEE